jgi:hypothetical protein
MLQDPREPDRNRQDDTEVVYILPFLATDSSVFGTNAFIQRGKQITVKWLLTAVDVLRFSRSRGSTL